jgi:hypothetical protein
MAMMVHIYLGCSHAVASVQIQDDRLTRNLPTFSFVPPLCVVVSQCCPPVFYAIH